MGALRLDAFGVGVELAVEDSFQDRLVEELSFFAKPSMRAPERMVRLTTSASEDGGSRWSLGTVASGVARSVDQLLLEVRGALESFVAEHSPTHVFVHAGVVAHNDAAIVLPGVSHAGKSSAVEALVDHGGTYYSDEFAVLDRDGLVHAFPRPLNRRRDQRVELRLLGAGGPPIPIRLVVLTRFAAGLSWAPVAIDAGTAVLKIIEHAVAARTAPERVLAAISNGLQGARVLEGYRGESDEFARQVLGAL